jgi:hypothetical protein
MLRQSHRTENTKKEQRREKEGRRRHKSWRCAPRRALLQTKERIEYNNEEEEKEPYFKLVASVRCSLSEACSLAESPYRAAKSTSCASHNNCDNYLIAGPSAVTGPGFTDHLMR